MEQGLGYSTINKTIIFCFFFPIPFSIRPSFLSLLNLIKVFGSCHCSSCLPRISRVVRSFPSAYFFEYTVLASPN